MFNPAEHNRDATESDPSKFDRWLRPFEFKLRITWLDISAARFYRHYVHSAERWKSLSDVDRHRAERTLKKLARSGSFDDRLIADALAWVTCGALAGKIAKFGEAVTIRNMIHGVTGNVQRQEFAQQLTDIAACCGTLAKPTVHYVVGRRCTTAQWDHLREICHDLKLSFGLITDSMGKTERKRLYTRQIVVVPAYLIAQDYLYDSVVLGQQQTLRRELTSLLHETNDGLERLVGGLGWLAVHNAQALLIEEALSNVALFQNASDSALKKYFEHALGLVQRLSADVDFSVENSGVVNILPSGKEKLASAGARGTMRVWRASRFREYLVRRMLEALYVLEVDSEYEVAKNQIVVLPTARYPIQREIVCALCVKHGVDGGYSGEELARISMLEFFGRYQRVVACGRFLETSRPVLSHSYGLAMGSSHRRSKFQFATELAIDPQAMFGRIDREVASDRDGTVLVVADTNECAKALGESKIATVDSTNIGDIPGVAWMPQTSVGSPSGAERLRELAPRLIVCCDSLQSREEAAAMLEDLDIDTVQSILVITGPFGVQPNGVEKVLRAVFGRYANRWVVRKARVQRSRKVLVQHQQLMERDAYRHKLLAFAGRAKA